MVYATIGAMSIVYRFEYQSNQYLYKFLLPHRKLAWCIPVSLETAAYRKVSNIRRTLVGSKIVDHSDVVGASPVGAAPTTSSFST